MFSDGVIDLFYKGVITNMNKSVMRGFGVTTFIAGSQRLYDFVDGNPEIHFMDVATVNDPRVIGRNERVTAINSAIEVDITGQVCADSVGTRMISGVGGQVDFERGAAISKQGLPMICLPSTTSDGSSRIVPLLKPGAGVITSRNHVYWIVTEYGAVNLHGLTLSERAKAIISVAHPKHRESLTKAAYLRFKQ